MGDSLSETVRKIMQKLFTDNFLAHYSFIGFKGKLTFSNLQHCAVIIGKYFFYIYNNVCILIHN